MGCERARGEAVVASLGSNKTGLRATEAQSAMLGLPYVSQLLLPEQTIHTRLFEPPPYLRMPQNILSWYKCHLGGLYDF